MAAKLLKNEPLNYEGNPLLDFSLVNMLDRFSFKKARLRKGKSGGFQKLIEKNKLRRSKLEEPLSIKSMVLRHEEQFFAPYFERKKELKKDKKMRKDIGQEEFFDQLLK